MLLGVVKRSANIFLSELMMKRPHLSFTISVPTQIISKPLAMLVDATVTVQFSFATLFYINRLTVTN